MSEITFLVEPAPEGGYVARALGAAIFTQADDLDGLRRNVREATECHFDEARSADMTRRICTRIPNALTRRVFEDTDAGRNIQAIERIAGFFERVEGDGE